MSGSSLRGGSPDSSALLDPARREARRERLLAVIREEAADGAQGPAEVAPAVPSRPTRRWVLVAAGSTLSAAALGVGVVAARRGREPVAGAVATPPVLHYQLVSSRGPARRLLVRLADLAAARPESTGAPSVRYTAGRSWYLHTRVDGGTVTSRVVPSTEETWTRADGSGLVLRTTAGEQIRVDVPASRTYDVRNLPSDPAALRAALSVANTLDHGTAGYLEVVKDVWLTEAPGPQVQAGLLRLLATRPDLELRGDVLDRLGRPGVAVSATSAYGGLPTRYTLILDPGTGTLLGFEEELTESAGRLNVPVPSVIGYQVWSHTAWVTRVGDPPPPG